MERRVCASSWNTRRLDAQHLRICGEGKNGDWPGSCTMLWTRLVLVKGDSRKVNKYPLSLCLGFGRVEKTRGSWFEHIKKKDPKDFEKISISPDGKRIGSWKIHSWFFCHTWETSKQKQLQRSISWKQIRTEEEAELLTQAVGEAWASQEIWRKRD